MSEPIVPAAIMAAHHDNGLGWCFTCMPSKHKGVDWPCEPYRLAEALAAERARAARVSTVVEDYAQLTTTGRDWHLIRRLRDALADGLPK